MTLLNILFKLSQIFSLSLSSVAPTFEHKTSVQRFVSLQFVNPKTAGRTPWTGDQPVARPLPTQTQKIADIQALTGIRTQRSEGWSERRQFMPLTGQPL
jgi:hypothetical protein